MKKKSWWKIFKESFYKAEKKGEKIIKTTGEMTRQIEKMGKLGGVLYTCY